ncbi:Saccharopine dehydrogenase [Mycena indigotica]|uniref:Saccharopine dehydrogenase n=1 Tax=Mycena indigotica TaxID=2126181 RepID=A0A8H6TFD2_9AGAR|nr:Saccharopine dehydrogenase [Mycena indigotica]KAF7316341.1 Saccharopine dehydrogenase [Mycena indigotica]
MTTSLNSDTTKPTKQILVLGAGFVARPCVEYLAREPSNKITIACRTLSAAEACGAGLPSISAISLDVSDTPTLEAAVAAHDLVISLVPYTYHATVIKAAIQGKTNVVTTSYVSPAMRDLEPAAREAGIVVLNEVGVDPGIDHLYAIKVIEDTHAKGGKIKEFFSCCGGLPAPEATNNPLRYKFSWSVRGGLLVCFTPASVLSSGVVKHISGADLMQHAHPYSIPPNFSFVAFPNRNSLPFQTYYNIPEAETVIRSTLRHEGFTEFVIAFSKLGLLDSEPKEWLQDGIEWRELTRRLAGANAYDEETLASRIKTICSFSSDLENDRIVDGLRWLGLFSTDKVLARNHNLFDTFCAHLEGQMKYQPGERDMIMLQHKFVVQWADGKQETITSTLEAYGTPGGHSAMALTVGIPCGIASQLVLDGVIKTPGVHAPYSKDICDPIREKVELEGLGLVERVL